MKAGAIIGVLIAVGGIIMGGIMEGVPPTALFAPSAALIIGAGTLGATMASFGMEGMKQIPAGYKKALMSDVPDKGAQVERLVGFADTARRDGLLALESQLADIDDEFTRKGLQLVVDGSDSGLVEDILHLEVETMQTRHKLAEDVFRSASGFAPTVGVLGTVIALVHVLGNLSDPDALGPAISVAFLATLMGVGSANVVFLPIATRLKQVSGWEVEFRHLTIEGIMALQAGENPRVVADKLMAYLPPKQRDSVNLPGSPKLQAVDGDKKAA